MNKTKYTIFQKTINYTFRNINLLIQALTHKSYLNENKNLKLISYERLEFLGDSIVEFWISKTLYSKFPNYDEGKLTALRSLTVCTKSLSKVAHSIGQGDYLLLSNGEEKNNGRQNNSTLEDSFEALVGAIFIDSDLQAAENFLDKWLLPQLLKLSKQQDYKDPKSVFQEKAQAIYNVTPHYQTLKETGPDHDKKFKVGVFIGDKQIATGIGHSKQKAEERASIKATKIITDPV